MFKNKKVTAIILSIILLVFSINGLTAYYKYTQESGTNFFVNVSDKSDALEDTNEVRQILDDLGNLLGHSKRDDSYPKDLTTGGDIDINRVTTKSAVATLTTGEAGFVKVSAAAGYSLTLPTAVGNKLTYIFVKTDDNASLITIDGNASETINGSLTYTGLNSQYAYVAIRSDNANWFILFSSVGGYTNLTSFVDQTAWRLFYSDTDGDVIELALGADGTYLGSNGAAAAPTFTVPAGAGTVITSGTPVDDDYAKFTAETIIEGRSYAEMKTDLGFMTDLVDDTTPESGGEHNFGAHSAGFTVQTIESTTGTATINWGNSNKARITLSENTTLAFTNPANSGNYMLIIIQPAGENAYTTTFPAGIYWANSTKVSVPTTGNNRCIVSFLFDDEDVSDVWYCQGTETFATDD